MTRREQWWRKLEEGVLLEEEFAELAAKPDELEGVLEDLVAQGRAGPIETLLGWIDDLDLPCRPDLLLAAARVLPKPDAAIRRLLSSRDADREAVRAFARDASLPLAARAAAIRELALDAKRTGQRASFPRDAAQALASELLDERAARVLLHAAGILGDFALRGEIAEKLRETGLEWVVEEEQRGGGAGTAGETPRTIVRPGAKVRRNDPCPCGSGKKTKHCCWEKIQRSGGVYRPSRALAVDPRDLTLEGLGSLDRGALESLDPEALTKEQLTEVCAALASYRAFSAADRFVAELQKREAPIEDVLWDLFDWALWSRETEIAERYLAALPGGKDVRLAGFEVRICGAQEQGFAEIAEELEDLAEECILGGMRAIDLASTIERPFPALSLLLARAASLEYEPGDPPHPYLLAIQTARERLELEVRGDPAEKLLVPGPPPSAPPPEIAAARVELERIQADRRRLLEELAGRNRELRLLRRRMEDLEDEVRYAAAPRPQDPQAATSERVEKLRRDVERLQGEIREQQAERRQLRRALEGARREAERLADARPERHAGPAEGTAAGAPPETEVPPVAIVPSFSPRFCKEIAELPPAVGARALRRVIGLATGDPKDGRQAKRLMKTRNIYSLRVGIHHRLLVHWVPGKSMRAEALIRRADLERVLREWL